MSLKAYQKLYGKDDLAAWKSISSESEDDHIPSQPRNTFALLDEQEDEVEHNAPENLQDEESQSTKPSQAPPGSQKKAAKRRKKKGKKITNPASAPEEQKVDDEDVDALIAQLGMQTGIVTSVSTSGSSQCSSGYSYSLLQIDHRYLNPNNEMKRKFGERVIGGDRGHRKYRRSMHLVTPSSEWPPMHKFGLEMRLGIDSGSEQEFFFHHKAEYRAIQHKFWLAVDAMVPENLTAVYRVHPYHIDTLIQLSEICRMSEDLQVAAELIEKALYTFESSFHPLFNMAGKCRIRYKRWENRGLFLALFRHLHSIGDRGCYRTALEFTKLMLSLDPDVDPLCALLLLDSFALKSESYQYLLDLYTQWNPARNLRSLPNFAFSVPLSLFWLAKGDEPKLEEASDMLRESIQMFPGLIQPLLDKCGVNVDSDSLFKKYFNHQYESMPSSLKQLTQLYIARCHHSWKEPDCLAWLEENVRLVSTLAESDNARVLMETCNKYNKQFHGKPPRNIARHILISDITEAQIDLPQEYLEGGVMNFDPVPPLDGEASYTKPPAPPRRVENLGILQALLNSIRPDFNPAAVVQPGELPDQAGGFNAEAFGNAIRELMAGIRFNNPDRDDGEAGEGAPPEDQEWD